LPAEYPMSGMIPALTASWTRVGGQAIKDGHDTVGGELGGTVQRTSGFAESLAGAEAR
jgi:hypothetical protein